MSQTFNDFFELSFFPQGGDAPLVTLKKQELGERVWIILGGFCQHEKDFLDIK